MNAEIICVGTEILLGNIINTNSAFLSKKLSELGINLYYHTVVGDNEKRLLAAIEIAKKRSDLIIFTGGLGPTYDDITKETVAKSFKRDLYLDKESLNSIKEYFKSAGKNMTDNNIKQAYIIEGSEIFPNMNGTAPGMVFEDNNTTIAILPGPPSEMSMMFDLSLYPYLLKKSDKTFYSHTLRIFGIGESKVENDLIDIMEKSVNPTIAPYAKCGEVELRITAAENSQNEADKKIIPYINKIKNIYGVNLYGTDVPNLESQVVKLLSERHMTVSFAESCTGGLLAKRITDISGASNVIGLSAVTYSNEAKTKLLNVNIETIKKYGAVSKECAIEMAEGMQKFSDSDIAVSVTGVAGPDISENKPVGLVYLGIKQKGKTPYSIELNLAKTKIQQRETIRTLAASNALFEILKLL